MEQRSGTDQAHLTPEDIEQFRKLVEARLPQERAEWREALCVWQQLTSLIPSAGHRSKLEQRERGLV